MQVKPADVKKLREKTGAGMLDCKNALVKAEGDAGQAEKILKEMGLAVAAKRRGRATNEGRVFSKIDGDKGVLLELSCETDFVARNAEFIALGNDLMDTILQQGLAEPNDALEQKMQDAVSRIKENLALRRFQTMKAGADELLVDYIHGEGSIGVMVKVKLSDSKLLNDERVRAFAFDLALHVAAYSPLYLSKQSVDKAYLDEQEGVFRKQAESLDKPEKVLAGIVKGKLNKHLAEICLLDQGFVKEEKKTVAQAASDFGKEVACNIAVVDFVYYKVGEEV